MAGFSTPPAGVDVSDADAAVGDVKSPKTFYSVAAPKKTGIMPTQTLDPASENVPAGYYAATTLSAVDEHLAPANIKKDVNIFGKVGTVAPGITFSDYHHYEALAAGTSYTPTAQLIATLFNETGALNSEDVHIEFYNGSEWVNAHTTTPFEASRLILQDNSQNLRVYAVIVHKISLTGVIWSGITFSDYHHYETLASDATYIPTAQSIATLFQVAGVLGSTDVHVQFYNGSAWVNAHTTTHDATCNVFQNNSQNLRVYGAYIARKIGLIGVIWS